MVCDVCENKSRCSTHRHDLGDNQNQPYATETEISS